MVFLYAQSTQASADNVVIRRPVVLGGDPIDVVQEATRQKTNNGIGEESVDPDAVIGCQIRIRQSQLSDVRR